MTRFIFGAVVLLGLSGCSNAAPHEELVAVQRAELVGGRPALESEYQSSIIYSTNTDTGELVSCSGTKVGPRHFLVASHCVTDTNTGELTSPHRPGGTISLTGDNNGLHLYTLTVVRSWLPTPYFWVTAPDQDRPDAAVIEVVEPTSDIPI